MPDRALSPEEIMDELEKRVGPEGRKLFERFLRQVNKLQAQQQLEAQAQTGDNYAHWSNAPTSPSAATAITTNPRWTSASKLL